MNKYDNIIHDFLLQHKKLTLGKMGSFSIITEPAQGQEAGDVVFVADKKAETSGELLDLIAEKSGKGRGLVAADLESYLEQVRQFINIGKPYIIEDVGVISLNKSGNYEFTRHTGIALATNNAQVDQHFLPENTGMVARLGKRNGIMGVAFIVVLLVLAGVGYGIYSMVGGSKSSSDDAVVTAPPAADTQPVSVAPPATTSDSVSTKPADSVATVTPTVTAPATEVIASKDSGRYKFIFETTPSAERARTRTAQLISFGDPAGYDSVKQEDGSYAYRLFLKQKVAVANANRAKDSIQIYLSKPVTMVKE